jgi:hypothetical protein
MHRVPFTLSFENYLDWVGAHEKPRQQRVVGKTLTLGLALVCLGFLFARWSSNSAPPAGALALFFGLLLTLACLPLWFLLERRNPERMRAEQKKNFEAYFLDPRIFEFDESKWSLTYGGATNSRTWDDLTSFRDAGRTIILADTFVWYPLAGAAFAKEQRDRLKELCERALSAAPILFSVSMFCTPASFVRSMIAYRWGRRTRLMLSLYALGAVLAWLMALIFADAMNVSALPIAFGLMLLMPLFEIAHDRKKFHSYYALYSFHTADVSEASICFRKPLELRRVRWNWLVDFFETPWEFQLYVSEEWFYLLPKAGLSPENLDRLRQLARQPKLQQDRR